MTLTSLKRKIKVISIFVFLVVYGVAAFNIGRLGSIKNTFQRVKGVSTSANGNNDSIEKPLPYTDLQTTEVIGTYVKHCANTANGFQVDYPKDWFTTYNQQEQQCLFFAPYSFIVPSQTEDDFVPIKIELISPSDWQLSVDYHQTPNELFNINSSQTLEINGKSVLKIDASATGEGSIDRGFSKVTYIVQDAQKPLIVSFTQLKKDDDVASFVKVVESMLTSFKYF